MNITTLCGDRVVHPLLISVANIKMSKCLTLSSNSFMLTALLPIPKFIHHNKCMHGILKDRLIHQCLNIIFQPVKDAAKHGIMLPDFDGHIQYCFTPLASYITDMPKACMLSCVRGKTSLVTMVMFKQFRDSFCHEPWTGTMTITQLRVVKSKVNPSDLIAFFHEAQHFHLNGISEPFFQDFLLSCSSVFLTPKMMHHVHKEFWDHNAKWCLNIVGKFKLDFWLSVLQPTSSFCHFKTRISQLKQVTGHIHCDVQCYIVGIIASAAPPQFIVAIRLLMDFRYRVQAYHINDDELQLISSALDTFHANKQSILDCKARRGKGNKVIDNWYIPKLELMQSFVSSIKQLSTTIQWTADITEHAHVTEIKTPARASNNNNYDPQICRFLDRAEKCQVFELATLIRQKDLFTPPQDLGDVNHEIDESQRDDEDSNETEPDIMPTTSLAHPPTNYFTISICLHSKD